jgi:uncharacterized protein (TIGR03084 family)
VATNAAIFDDLEAEEDRIEGILEGLDDDAWRSPSAAAGWTVADVVLHLAQTEEVLVASANGRQFGLRVFGESRSVDDWAEQAVRSDPAEPNVVFDRWKAARRNALAILRETPPGQAIGWAVMPLKPASLATTRLAEHWAHALDITSPLRIAYPDTDRLRHIAWLAHRTLPYAFSVLGSEPHDVLCELTGPHGGVWRYGPDGAASAITGSAGAFCRVGARRLAPEESGLNVRGPHGADALRALRNYAA